MFSAILLSSAVVASRSIPAPVAQPNHGDSSKPQAESINGLSAAPDLDPTAGVRDAESRGVKVAEPEGAEPEGAEPEGAEPEGAEPETTASSLPRIDESTDVATNSDLQDAFAPPVPYQAPPPSGYQYPGRNFGWWDAGAAALTQGLYYVVEYTQEGPERADWKSALFLDRPVRDAIVAKTRKRREAADRASDYLWYTSIVYPFLSATIVPLVRGSDWRPPVMMNLINMQAFVATGLIVRMPHKWIGRMRPNYYGCKEEGDEYDAQCGSKSQRVSFPSGHTQVAMTGAGLTCAHHIHGALLGNPIADAAACGAGVAAASAVGYLRMRADRHWLSDTIVGAGIGFAIGYGIPTLFYYHPFWESDEKRAEKKDQQTGVLVLPFASPGPGGLSGGGLSVVGVVD